MASIKTPEQLERWLDNQPKEVCVAIATRAALRVFPLVTHIALVTPIDRQRETKETLALLTARCILTSGVEAVLPAPDVRAAADAAAVAATIAARAAATARAAAYIDSDAAARHAARSADGASRASRAAARAASVATDAADAARAAADTASNEVAEARNATYADTELTSQNLMAGKLWGNLSEPDWLVARIEPNILDSRTEWAFWRRWYQGFLIGEPLDWELQRRVALIDEEDWDRGPDHIARLIEELDAHFELERRVRDLEKELVQPSLVSRLSIGGNNPPEPIEGTPSIARDLPLIGVPLKQLKEEMEADAPDKALLSAAIDALKTGLNKGIAWCASKTDLAIDTTIKWGIPTAGGYLVMNPDKLSAVIEAAQRWLSLLG